MRHQAHLLQTLVLTYGILFFCGKTFSQKDTLHLYFVGLQTKIADSNDVKISKWASKVKGKHAWIEIYTYYDNAEFKKYMQERADEVNLTVIRKVRDYVTVKFAGPVKGKKSKRSVADIVYQIDEPSSEESSGTSGNDNSTSTESSTSTPTKSTTTQKDSKTESKTDSKSGTTTQKNNKTNSEQGTAVGESATESNSSTETNSLYNQKPDANGYIYDSVYVNGKLKVTRRKAKKK